jgi:CheY-like chemotaxis protein
MKYNWPHCGMRHDRLIEPGQNWSSEIADALSQADVVLLLVSSDFINSDYCYSKEMAVALERHRAKLAEVVPILVRPVDWTDAPFSHLQALPPDAKPVISWSIRDEAWTQVAKGIRQVVERVSPLSPINRRSAPESQNDAPEIARAVETFTARMGEAAASKNVQSNEDEGREAASHLAALRQPKIVLWVDDHPGNNVNEMAALYAMQIDIETATSTEQALALVDSGIFFDLIVTDWNRSPQHHAGTPEGLRLLKELSCRRISASVLVYHGAFAPSAVKFRDAKARAAGAKGATPYPNVLLKWCVDALQQSPVPDSFPRHLEPS